MSTELKEFNKLKRSWIFNTVLELVAMVGFFATYFTHGDTNTLVFWSVMFLWNRSDAKESYREMMEMKP